MEFIRLACLAHLSASSDDSDDDSGDGFTIAGVSAQARCFSHGSYTLISDPDYKAGVYKAKAQKVASTNASEKTPAAVAQAAGASSAGVGGGAAGGSKRPRSEEGAKSSSGSGKGGKGKDGKRPRLDSADDDADGDSDATSTAPPTLIDATLCCISSPEWPESHGGYVSYLTSDEELLSVPPKANSLSLVLRPPGVMSFVKYVNHMGRENRYDYALQFMLAQAARD